MTRRVTEGRAARRALGVAALALALSGAVAGLPACDAEPDVAAASVETRADPARAAPDYPATCGDLAHAPPPFALPDGADAAPVDVLAVDATLAFDADAGRATGSGRVVFTTGDGPAAYPVLALGQLITAARLDGRPLPTSALALAVPSPTSGELWVVREALAPCTTHELTLEWVIALPPPSPFPVPLALGDGLAVFSANLTDLEPGGYIDRWLPANLAFDAFALTLRIRLEGAAEVHALVSNAASEERAAAGLWTLRWPATSDAMSPLVVLAPASWVARRDLPDAGARVAIVDPEADDDGLDALADVTTAALSRATERFGPRPGAGAYLVAQGDFDGSLVVAGMEYDHAALVGAPAPYTVDHEVLHAWFGRDGFRPASDRDGWIDEAVATWADGSPTPPFEGPAPPRQVGFGDPWRRSTPHWAYREGASFVATVAAWSSPARVDAALRGLVTPPGRRLDTTGFLCALGGAMGDGYGAERVIALFRALCPDAELDDDALAACVAALPGPSNRAPVPP